ncbi:alkaline phosphatase family protein [Halorubrum vacuolatum]|uniref:Sulfatase n=1 Tax=Halorubrum vacuolatum TaxID=63740 RepID=A0A238XQ15_HALVU|nr:hypothetical protein [Halorubrum vacuolatum]SNR61037.1 hypothetical protein SAMN06264855_12125 [Halorubrum vacuolatum]
MQEGEVDFFDDYERGCRRARERFTDQMAFLEDRGWLEDTFVVSTADHGEVFGHHDGRPDHWNHTVDCTEVVEVPVLFYGRDVDIDSPVHLEDLLELWWPHWSTIRDGRLEAERKTDTTEMTVEDKERTEDRLRQLGYLE